MSKIITITNQKGGVGKTTTSSSLLTALYQRGARVLGIDLDPQGSLGFCLGLDIGSCATIYDVMRGDKAVNDVIVETECGDILPSNILLSGAELEFNRPGREFMLKTHLNELDNEYDFIIIDTLLPIGFLQFRIASGILFKSLFRRDSICQKSAFGLGYIHAFHIGKQFCFLFQPILSKLQALYV